MASQRVTLTSTLSLRLTSDEYIKCSKIYIPKATHGTYWLRRACMKTLNLSIASVVD